MKISNIGSAYNIYSKKPVVSRKKSIGTDVFDSFNVSNEAREFQVALKAASSTPEVREDKITAIKKQIDSGNYNISAEAVAEKMMFWLA